MNKTLEEFMVDNFEELVGQMDELEDTVDIWDYEGNQLLFSLTDYRDGTYKMTLWNENNKTALAERNYISATEGDLVHAVKYRLSEVEENKNV